MAAALNPADLAGNWRVQGMTETSDSVIVEYTMTATADLTTWVLNLTGRPPITPTVMVAGDSVVMDAGPYESVLRPGVQVTTHSVSRMQGAELVGTVTARYATSAGDSVVTLRSRATRVP